MVSWGGQWKVILLGDVPQIYSLGSLATNDPPLTRPELRHRWERYGPGPTIRAYRMLVSCRLPLIYILVLEPLRK